MRALRLVALIAACLLSLGGVARADPISLAAYRQALADVRAQVLAARATGGVAREATLATAIGALDALREVRVDTAIYTAPPHALLTALLRRGDDANLDLAAGVLAETLRALEPSRGGSLLDPAQARRSLDGVFSSTDFERTPDWRDVVADLLRRAVAVVLPDLRAPTIQRLWVTLALAPIAVGLALLVFWVTGAGLRERVRREVALRVATETRRSTAGDRLRAAEAALAAGRARDAVRELFLFALVALEERELLRVDPALTDREVLARAAGLPHARDLAALADVYERSWYGVRDPSDAEVARANDLARRIAA